MLGANWIIPMRSHRTSGSAAPVTAMRAMPRFRVATSLILGTLLLAGGCAQTLEFRVLDARTGQALSGVTVERLSTDAAATQIYSLGSTALDGRGVAAGLLPGMDHAVFFSKEGYVTRYAAISPGHHDSLDGRSMLWHYLLPRGPDKATVDLDMHPDARTHQFLGVGCSKGIIPIRMYRKNGEVLPVEWPEIVTEHDESQTDIGR